MIWDALQIWTFTSPSTSSISPEEQREARRKEKVGKEDEFINTISLEKVMSKISVQSFRPSHGADALKLFVLSEASR